MILTNKSTFPAADFAPISIPKNRTASWGWLPALTLLSAIATLVVAASYAANPQGSAWAPLAYWAGLLLIFVPAAFRLSLTSPTREERIGLLVVAGLAFYFVKVLYSPLEFKLHDEFLHWRTANDIFLSGRLFLENPLLVVSPLYPGLEVITTAFAHLSGLSVVDAGFVTLGAGRIILMLMLFVFFEQVGRSAQLGGIATLLYMGNSNFLLFDSQFAYESLSLPLATTVLCLVLLKQHVATFSFRKLLIIVTPILITIAITHHLTGYVLAGLLSVWVVAGLLKHTRRRDWITVAVIAGLAVLFIGLWTLYTGNVARGYLDPVLGGGFTEFAQLILGEETGRQLFQSATGQTSPAWERIVGILSAVGIVAILPIGIRQILQAPFTNRLFKRGVQVFRARNLRAWYVNDRNAVALALAGVALLYPVLLGLRLTSSGWEIANRSSEFVFWAVAFVVGVGALRLRPSRHSPHLWRAGFVVGATIIFLGGVIAGWSPWGRLPGSYQVSADAQSVEPQSVTAAQWAGEHLDADDRISTDRINTLLLGVYGHLNPVTHQADGVYLSTIFLSETLGAAELALMRAVNLQYVLVDERLSTGLPQVGVYFEPGEPNSRQYTVPASLQALTKFDQYPQSSRLFDSGAITIYDVSSLYDQP